MSRTVKEKPTTKPPNWEALHPQVTDELLAEMTRRIVEKFHPYKVILFGSYVYGTPHIYSDVDLLVIMDSDERPAKRSISVYEAAKVDFLPMDMMVRTPEEIEARLAIGDFFIKEILEKGKVLYNHDASG